MNAPTVVPTIEAPVVAEAPPIEAAAPEVPPPTIEAPAEEPGPRNVVDSLGNDAPEKTKLQRSLEVAEQMRQRGLRRRRDMAARAQAEQRASAVEQELARTRAERDQLAWIAKGPEQPPDNSPEALRREIADLKQQIATNNQEQAAANQRAALVAANQNFVRVAQEGETYPNVASHLEVRREGVLAEAHAFVKYQMARGVQPSDKDVLQWLEGEYSKIASKAQARSSGKGGSGGAPAGANGGGAAASGAKTLTSRATERASLPVSFDDLSPDEQLSVMARQLRAAQTR